MQNISQTQRRNAHLIQSGQGWLFPSIKVLEGLCGFPKGQLQKVGLHLPGTPETPETSLPEAFSISDVGMTFKEPLQQLVEMNPRDV